MKHVTTLVFERSSCSLESSFQEETSVSEVEAHLHNGWRETLNIQDNTFGNGTLNNHQDPQDHARNASCIRATSQNENTSSPKYYWPTSCLFCQRSQKYSSSLYVIRLIWHVLMKLGRKIA